MDWYLFFYENWLDALYAAAEPEPEPPALPDERKWDEIPF